MKHARADYNRIQDPAVNDPSLLSEGSTPIGFDEPVFLIRAKDAVAPDAVDAWADLADDAGADENIVAVARRQASAMREWQRKHGSQVPDMPE